MKNSWILMVMVLCTSACGEVSYKRGASARDLEMAHHACRNGEESALSSCLEKQGWQVQKFDDSELFAEASVTDNRGNGKATTDQVTGGVVAPDSMENTQPNQSLTNPAEADSSLVAKEAPAKHPVKTPQKIDPMQTYQINSWWKLGASSAALMTDQKACGTLLGAAHAPEFKTQTYTRGFITCMHSKGWKALKAIR